MKEVETGTWLFYNVLVDLGDAIADEVSFPFDRISLETIYLGLYHFYVAHHKRLALLGFGEGLANALLNISQPLQIKIWVLLNLFASHSSN